MAGLLGVEYVLWSLFRYYYSTWEGSMTKVGGNGKTHVYRSKCNIFCVRILALGSGNEVKRKSSLLISARLDTQSSKQVPFKHLAYYMHMYS